MKCKLVLVCVVSAVLGGSIINTAQAKSAKVTFGCPNVVRAIYKERTATRTYEYKMHHSPSRSNFNASKVRSCAYATWVKKYWAKMHRLRSSQFRSWLKSERRVQSQEDSGLVNDFLCIHHFEGAWNANTGNGYYGGLQMDSGFMKSYGSQYLDQYGTADKWPASVQIQVAIYAYSHGRGFGPWPNTARLCGLL